MSRFVLLSHDWPHPHHDLLLEWDGVLKAWRLPAEFTPGEPAEAEAIADHRLAYLDYEGPVSGDRGRVVRHDAGGLEWVTVAPDRVTARIIGAALNGVFELTHVEGVWWRFSRATAPPEPPGSPPPPS